MWEGPKIDMELCLNFLGIPNVNYASYLPSFVSSFMSQHGSSVQIWRDPNRSNDVIDGAASQRGSFYSLCDLVPLVHELRLIKSPAEQELMRKTCRIISNAVQDTMKVGHCFFYVNWNLSFISYSHYTACLSCT